MHTAPHTRPDPGYMGDPRRGAGCGRPQFYGRGAEPAEPFTLQRVRLNSGGYDAGGSYWGLGPRLYWACAESLEGKNISFNFRASDRADAKARILVDYPTAKFLR